MKKIVLYFTASLMMLYFSACKPKTDPVPEIVLTGVWTAGTDFEGISRSNAVAFTINNKAYVGTGFSGTTRLKDFWEFDGTTWTQVADIPGVARDKATGFGLTNKGYLGTGFDGTNLLNDFYEYTPGQGSGQNVWVANASFAGSARSGAVGFAIDSIGVSLGFIGTGFDGNYKNDVYKFRPSVSGGTWIKAATLPKKTSAAVAFVIDTTAYICSGVNNGVYLNEVFGYNPLQDRWSPKASLSGTLPDGVTAYDLRRSDAASFSFQGQGYVLGGYTGFSITNSAWVYSPGGNSWAQLNVIPGSARMNAVGFALKNVNNNERAFVATGRNNNARFDDVWEFHP